MNTPEGFEPICCPEINPNEWQDKLMVWENKKFIKDRVCTFFYMPLNFGKVITRLMAKVEKAGVTVPDNLGLSDHTSKWNMDIYLAVDQEVPDVENVSLSGKFFARTYEGPFQDTGKWYKDFLSRTKEMGLVIVKSYMWYTTCPKCAKKYGKNYVVIIGEVE